MVFGVFIAFVFLSLSFLITTWMKSKGGASVENDPSSSTPPPSFILSPTLEVFEVKSWISLFFLRKMDPQIILLINNLYVSCEITQILFCLGNATWEGIRFLYLFSYITCLQISNYLHLTLNDSKVLSQSVHIPTFFRWRLPPSTKFTYHFLHTYVSERFWNSFIRRIFRARRSKM